MWGKVWKSVGKCVGVWGKVWYTLPPSPTPPHLTSPHTFSHSLDLSQHLPTSPTSPHLSPPQHISHTSPQTPNTPPHASPHYPHLPHIQGWEKSIFDCDILYFLFIACIEAFTFLNGYRIWPCLYLFSAQFHIPYSVLFVQITLSHFSKFKIIVGMPLPCFC